MYIDLVCRNAFVALEIGIIPRFYSVYSQEDRVRSQGLIDTEIRISLVGGYLTSQDTFSDTFNRLSTGMFSQTRCEVLLVLHYDHGKRVMKRQITKSHHKEYIFYCRSKRAV